MSSSKRKREADFPSDHHASPADGTLVKKFLCDFDGCGKSYSRAEHLARHQLNHSPREIFRCEYPQCSRWFVRRDLCARHYERHFQDRESDIDALQAARANGSPMRVSPASERPKKRRVGRPKLADKRPPTPTTTTSADTMSRNAGHTDRPNNLPLSDAMYQPAEAGHRNQRVPPVTDFEEVRLTGRGSSHDRFHVLPLPDGSAAPGDATIIQHSALSHASLSARDQRVSTGFAPPNAPHPPHIARDDTLESTNLPAASVNPQKSMPNHSILGASPTTGLFPNYYDQISDSPGSARNDEFTSWLFDDLQNFYSGVGPVGFHTPIGLPDLADELYPSQLPNSMESFGIPGLARQDSQWSVKLSPNHDQQFAEHRWLTETRWRHLVEFLQLFFNEGASSRGHFDKDAILGGDIEAEDHVLSHKMMNAYIVSYWHSYHEQMPILHKPTFSVDDTQELLLLAVIMVGAAHIQSSMGEYIKDNAHHFATFVAWHIRWHIFMHDDFHPPAKLWVLQALILLEVFEKMKATRFLHERANLHNATTISLVRRGTALTDASVLPDMAGGGMTPREWWNRWVKAEAMRRAAFAAFLIDASHASMFGHSNVMVAHEIQLPLPCDDALWSATSPSEVGRIEASLYANNVRPLTFLQSLKRMLSGRKVRTNAFGRMVLLAGLQSVSWHMRQREKVSNLGRGLGAPEIWRQTLIKAFDFWKKDFDEDFSHRQRAFMAWQSSSAMADSRTIAEYASAMHHLSHLAMQMDVHDAQIMAGAVKLVSRTITDADRERVSRRLSHWRETAGADIAFQHAVQLLLDYIPEGSETDGIPHYSITDDCLTMRPWTLYYAALTAWCYIFVRQHPSDQMSVASSDSTGAMESRRVSPEREAALGHGLTAHVRSSKGDSKNTRTNGGLARQPVQAHTVGRALGCDKSIPKFGTAQLTRTLRALQHTLRQSRWELLREAAERLRNALDMLAAASST